MELSREAWDRDVWFRGFGEETVFKSRGENKTTGVIMKGKKRKGPSNKSSGSSLARGGRACDGSRRGEARRKGDQASGVSTSPGSGQNIVFTHLCVQLEGDLKMAAARGKSDTMHTSKQYFTVLSLNFNSKLKNGMECIFNVLQF